MADSRQLKALRASLHNLCNTDLLTCLPQKAQETVFKYLPTEDIRNCRLVSRNWNSTAVKFITFWVELSDTSRFASMNLPSLEPLIVSRLVTRNLTQISNPEQLTDILQYFRMRSPEDVKSLIFREGTESSVQTKILKAFHRAEEVRILRASFPILPGGTPFENIKRLQISTLTFESTKVVKRFFLTATFPVLESLKIEFFARNDAFQYMGAHYFAAAHHKSLKNLSVHFGYYLSDMDQYSKDQLSVSEECAKRNAATQSMLVKDKRYRKLKVLLPLMKLENLTLNLSIYEGVHPWRLSLQLIDAQLNLQSLHVQYPFLLKNFSFSNVISRNAKQLEKLVIPCLGQDFDCSVLSHCRMLESFAIGKEFSFNYLFFGPRGSLINFPQFPPLPSLRSISICVPLGKDQILWLSSSTRTHSLLVYAVETEKFTFREVQRIIDERYRLRKIMMRIFMESEENKLLSNYFRNSKHLTVSDYFHAEDCGFTTFVAQKSWSSSSEVSEIFDVDSDEPGDDIGLYDSLVDDEQV